MTKGPPPVDHSHVTEKGWRSHRGCRVVLLVASVFVCLLILVPLGSQTVSDTTSSNIITNELEHIAKPPQHSLTSVATHDTSTQIPTSDPSNTGTYVSERITTTSNSAIPRDLSKRKGRSWFAKDTARAPEHKEIGAVEPPLPPSEHEPAPSTESQAPQQPKRRIGKRGVFRFNEGTPTYQDALVPAATLTPADQAPPSKAPDSEPSRTPFRRRRGRSIFGSALSDEKSVVEESAPVVATTESPKPSVAPRATAQPLQSFFFLVVADERVSICDVGEPNVSRLPLFRMLDHVRVSSTFKFTDEEMLQTGEPFYPETSLPYRPPADVGQHFATLPCRVRFGESRPVFVLTSVRNRAKRALEFAVHHLTLGAAKVFIFDVSTYRHRAGFRTASVATTAEHLEPLVAAGLVELLFPWDLSSHLILPGDRLHNGTTDLTRSLQLRELFFEELSLTLLATHPQSEILVLNDVRELVVVTGDAELLYGANVARHIRSASVPSWYPCLQDLVAFKEYRGVLLLPVVEVSDPKTAFEGPSVSGLELVSLATGDSDLMIKRVSALLHRDADGSRVGRGLRVATRLFGRSGAVSGLVRASSNENDLLSCGGRSLSMNGGCRRDVMFRDGTHLALEFPVKPEVLKNSARVLIVGDSLQRHILEAVDGCLRIGAADQISDIRPSFASDTLLRRHMETSEASMVDDLPLAYSIRKANSTFSMFFRDFLTFWGPRNVKPLAADPRLRSMSPTEMLRQSHEKRTVPMHRLFCVGRPQFGVRGRTFRMATRLMRTFNK